MMTNLEILSEDKILTLKNNKDQVLDCMLSSSDNSWLKDFFREENPFSKSKLMVKDFDLIIKKELDPDKTDFENAKILFNNIRLNESQACDERLWTGLALGRFYDYMLYRYPPTINSLKNKWFFQETNQKAQIFRQGLSMLWWYTYLTYDEKLDDPYELTEYAFKHKDFLISIYSRNFSGNKSITCGLLRATKDFEKDGGNISSKSIYNGIVKYLSLLGGACILDALSEEEIYNKCYIKLIDLYIKEYPDQKIFKL